MNSEVLASPPMSLVLTYTHKHTCTHYDESITGDIDVVLLCQAFKGLYRQYCCGNCVQVCCATKLPSIWLKVASCGQVKKIEQATPK